MGVSSPKKYKLVPGDPPDSGYGWIVALAGFLQHIIILGVCYTIGVYYPTLRDPDGLNADVSTLAWVATCNLFMFFGSGAYLNCTR